MLSPLGAPAALNLRKIGDRIPDADPFLRLLRPGESGPVTAGDDDESLPELRDAVPPSVDKTLFH